MIIFLNKIGNFQTIILSLIVKIPILNAIFHIQNRPLNLSRSYDSKNLAFLYKNDKKIKYFLKINLMRYFIKNDEIQNHKKI
ncbi:hypothetical protein F1B92_03515 [Campylobacter sp. FMV-PI01]|uniref:Uncharacterized protein n=1 Tax=Campylobacter portucalensis TaxID=2608384 RepID=A0A6L5WGW5_9BACT|nr:hypothetical protein [Campylobacter portucalensis]MSN96269.1 hypothetical protein [Campylobacter portucalensis]